MKKPLDKTKRASQVTGNVGMFYACYKLSMMGWNVMPTARNAKGIDIVAYPANANSFIGIQVKSLSQRTAVPLGKGLDGIMGDCWIVLNRVREEQPNCFILYPEEVKKLANRSGKNGNISYWLEPPDYDVKEFKEKWGRLDEILIHKEKSMNSSAITQNG